MLSSSIILAFLGCSVNYTVPLNKVEVIRLNVSSIEYKADPFTLQSPLNINEYMDNIYVETRFIKIYW
jgi:hypothetical protein